MITAPFVAGPFAGSTATVPKDTAFIHITLTPDDSAKGKPDRHLLVTRGIYHRGYLPNGLPKFTWNSNR